MQMGWGWGAERLLYILPVPWPEIRTPLVRRIRQWPKDIQLCCVEVTPRQKCDRAHAQPSDVARGCNSWLWLPTTLSGRSLAGGRWGGVGAQAQDLPPVAVASADAGARLWSLFLAMDTAIGRKRLSGSWGQFPGHQCTCAQGEVRAWGLHPARCPGLAGRPSTRQGLLSNSGHREVRCPALHAPPQLCLSAGWDPAQGKPAGRRLHSVAGKRMGGWTPCSPGRN